MDTPVHAHVIQAKAQFAEGRGCSSGIGVHTLSACGGQGEKAAAAHHSLGHDNSRMASVLWSQTIPIDSLEKLGCDLCPATLRLSGCPIRQSDIVPLAVISADRA